MTTSVRTILIGLVTVAVLGIATVAVIRFTDLGDPGTEAGPIAGQAPPFTVAEDGTVSVVPAESITVDASSFLEPVDGITYGPANTLDGDLNTAWNSDAAAEQGRGETITFRFVEPVDLQALQFVNGYAKSEAIYDANHRVQDMIVTTDGGSQRISLIDTTDRQEIVYDFGLTSKVIIRIEEVYPGSGFANPELTSDLAITEVVFEAIQR